MKRIVLFTAALAVVLFEFRFAYSQSADWTGAQWIWDAADADKGVQGDKPRQLRQKFELSGRPIAATLWITVDNHYTAYINGHKIGQDGEWGTIEKYDVGSQIVVGKNVLAIEAKNQGGPAGVIARLRVETADKKELSIVTDQRTRIREAANVGDREWLKPGFDDSSWSHAVALGDATIGPWNLGGASGKKVAGKSYDTNETVAVPGRLTPQEQTKHFVVPEDFAIELVAADPLVINPITMVMDDEGRIIVSESHTYRYGPNGSPIKPYANPVIRLDPDGKGGFKRTLIADGFADPVMGIAVKGDKLWLTANNYLYSYDLPASANANGDKAAAANKKTIITDLNKAWNPFGMFVL
jgi:hypothetical protein